MKGCFVKTTAVSLAMAFVILGNTNAIAYSKNNHFKHKDKLYSDSDYETLITSRTWEQYE